MFGKEEPGIIKDQSELNGDSKAKEPQPATV
jgi:hypothetical protein